LYEERNSTKKNTEALSDASKEVGQEVNAEKSKYMFMSCHWTTGQKYFIKATNNSFENVAKFNHLGTTVNRSKLHSQRKNSLLHVRNVCCKTERRHNLEHHNLQRNMFVDKQTRKLYILISNKQQVSTLEPHVGYSTVWSHYVLCTHDVKKKKRVKSKPLAYTISILIFFFI
jgi:hypothetical protein